MLSLLNPQAWTMSSGLGHKLSRAAGAEDLKMRSQSTPTLRARVLEPVVGGRSADYSSGELGSNPALLWFTV